MQLDVSEPMASQPVLLDLLDVGGATEDPGTAFPHNNFRIHERDYQRHSIKHTL